MAQEGSNEEQNWMPKISLDSPFQSCLPLCAGTMQASCSNRWREGRNTITIQTVL